MELCVFRNLVFVKGLKARLKARLKGLKARLKARLKGLKVRLKGLKVRP